ncbi:hypothetical protein PC123_g26443, partial [Phytophthora cactorum]
MVVAVAVVVGAGLEVRPRVEDGDDNMLLTAAVAARTHRLHIQ